MGSVCSIDRKNGELWGGERIYPSGPVEHDLEPFWEGIHSKARGEIAIFQFSSQVQQENAATLAQVSRSSGIRHNYLPVIRLLKP